MIYMYLIYIVSFHPANIGSRLSWRLTFNVLGAHPGGVDDSHLLSITKTKMSSSLYKPNGLEEIFLNVSDNKIDEH